MRFWPLVVEETASASLGRAAVVLWQGAAAGTPRRNAAEQEVVRDERASGLRDVRDFYCHAAITCGGDFADADRDGAAVIYTVEAHRDSGVGRVRGCHT